jgi:hypothetical protein
MLDPIRAAGLKLNGSEREQLQNNERHFHNGFSRVEEESDNEWRT